MTAFANMPINQLFPLLRNGLDITPSGLLPDATGVMEAVTDQDPGAGFLTRRLSLEEVVLGSRVRDSLLRFRELGDVAWQKHYRSLRSDRDHPDHFLLPRKQNGGSYADSWSFALGKSRRGGWTPSDAVSFVRDVPIQGTRNESCYDPFAFTDYALEQVRRDSQLTQYFCFTHWPCAGGIKPILRLIETAAGYPARTWERDMAVYYNRGTEPNNYVLEMNLQGPAFLLFLTAANLMNMPEGSTTLTRDQFLQGIHSLFEQAGKAGHEMGFDDYSFFRAVMSRSLKGATIVADAEDAGLLPPLKISFFEISHSYVKTDLPWNMIITMRLTRTDLESMKNKPTGMMALFLGLQRLQNQISYR